MRGHGREGTRERLGGLTTVVGEGAGAVMRLGLREHNRADRPGSRAFLFFKVIGWVDQRVGEMHGRVEREKWNVGWTPSSMQGTGEEYARHSGTG